MRPISASTPGKAWKFQSTHSLRSATDWSRRLLPRLPVSIHALLTECDRPLAGNAPNYQCFNPRTPYGVRRFITNPENASILFQSTHSLRSATLRRLRLRRRGRVSIHALLTECDLTNNERTTKRNSFNPRTPYGVRRWTPCSVTGSTRFQSTHSLRSATATRAAPGSTPCVSIHALLTECDPTAGKRGAGTESFNPRTPYGVRLFPTPTSSCGGKVSIHALLTECDSPGIALESRIPWFQSTHSLRSAT